MSVNEVVSGQGGGEPGDLQEALSQAIRAILFVTQAAEDRLTPEQLAEVKRGIAEGTRQLALYVTNDGRNVGASLALISAEAGEAFTSHLIKLQGSILIAAIPPGAVSSTDLRKLN